MNPMVALVCLFLVLLYLYIRSNDAKLMQLPHEVASAFSPKRISARDALEAAAISEKTTLDSKAFLPPRTGRRYIVVGGVCSIGHAELLRDHLLTWTPSSHSLSSGWLSRWLDRPPFAGARRAPEADQSPGHTRSRAPRSDDRLGQRCRLSSCRYLGSRAGPRGFQRTLAIIIVIVIYTTTTTTWGREPLPTRRDHRDGE